MVWFEEKENTSNSRVVTIGKLFIGNFPQKKWQSNVCIGMWFVWFFICFSKYILLIIELKTGERGEAYSTNDHGYEKYVLSSFFIKKTFIF